MLKTIKSLIAEGVIKEGTLLDLGCGAGKDAEFAAQSGFKVTAVDKKPLMEDIDSIRFVLGNIEDFDIEKDDYDVIFTENVLPFLSKEQAKNIIIDASDKLKQGGTFYFSIFGVNDGWASDEKMNFWTRDEALEFIQTLGLTIYRKVEEEGYAPKMNGEVKYWHIFRFILKK